MMRRKEMIVKNLELLNLKKLKPLLNLLNLVLLKKEKANNLALKRRAEKPLRDWV